MKITIDCPSKTHLMFINYVYRDDKFMMMGCKSIETDMLYDGAEYKLTDEMAFAPIEDEPQTEDKEVST